MNPARCEARNQRSRLALAGLCFSLVLNIALTWKISRLDWKSFPEPPSPRHSAGQVAVSPMGSNAVPNAEIPSAVAAPSLQWGQVEATDYRQYIANLRAIGCPEQLIRDIIRVDLAQSYAQRMRSVWSPSAVAYWQRGDNQQADPGQMKQIAALNREQEDVFAELFGSRSPAQDLIDLVFFQVHGDRQALSFLPPDRCEAALQALNDSDLEDELSVLDRPHSQQEEKARSEEQLKVLAKVLSPDELEAFRVRNSPIARSLQSELQYFDCTPEEFKRLMALREQSTNRSLGNLLNRTAATQQVREEFGEERAREFERVTDMFYINSRRGAEEHGVPVECADAAWTLIRDARTEADRIRSDTSLPVDTQKAQLQTLLDKTTAQLKETLGPAAARGVTRDLKTVFSFPHKN